MVLSCHRIVMNATALNWMFQYLLGQRPPLSTLTFHRPYTSSPPCRRLLQIEAEFHKHVDLRGAAATCGVATEALDFIYNYWKLKRKVRTDLRPAACLESDVPFVFCFIDNYSHIVFSKFLA